MSMLRPRIIVTLAAAFLGGGLLGYALPPAGEAAKEPSNSENGSRRSGKVPASPSRGARTAKSGAAREAESSSLTIDADGNYQLSPRLQNHFGWSSISESDVARSSLEDLGFSGAEIDKLSAGVKAVFRECGEREKAAASLFTARDGELVLKIAGDPAGAEKRKQRLMEILGEMDEVKAKLLGPRLFQELGKETCDLGAKDIFLRVTLTKSVPQDREFAYYADIGTPHEIELTPGSSLEEWRKAGLFPVRGFYGSHIPLDTKPLVEDEQWRKQMPKPHQPWEK